MRFEFHEEASGQVMAAQQDLFDHLDDPRNLARHMESPSAMMAGMRMSIETDNMRQGGRLDHTDARQHAQDSARA